MSNMKKFTRVLALFLVLCIVIGVLPAMATNNIDFNEDSKAVEDGKYILLGVLEENESGDSKTIVEILGQAGDDGTVEQAIPFVPFLRKLAVEWNMEQTQDIRIEVATEEGFVLGYIMEGTFRGQWGVLFGEQFDVHENVANRIIWDGTYVFDPEDLATCDESYY